MILARELYIIFGRIQEKFSKIIFIDRFLCVCVFKLMDKSLHELYHRSSKEFRNNLINAFSLGCFLFS